MLRNILVCLVLLGCAGCTRVSNKADRPDDPTFDRDPYEKVLLLIVDKSSSFSDLMKPGGKGLAFVNATIEELFRSRSGRNDHLIVSQLSGNRRSICWSGKPQTLRQELKTPDEFAGMLDSKADAKGSRIWDGISDSIELVKTDASLWNAKTKIAVVICSDMENTVVDNFTSEKRLDDNIADLAKHGGVIGMYYVEDPYLQQWRKKLKAFGFKDFVVEPASASKPKLPSFE